MSKKNADFSEKGIKNARLATLPTVYIPLIIMSVYIPLKKRYPSLLRGGRYYKKK